MTCSQADGRSPPRSPPRSLLINSIGSGRPSLKDLHDHVVNNAAVKLRDFGVQLLRPDQEKMLDIIAADHPHDVVSCCKCVLKKWLDTTSDATWNELIRALRSPSVQLNYVAGQIEQMFITESAVSVTSVGTGVTCEESTKLRHINIQFAKMTNRIKQALINSNVDVVSLIEQLCAISAVRGKKVPLFDEDVFEKIKSIDDFWKKLKNFWYIFDYELLQYVVEVSDCIEAQNILKEFLSKIDPSVIEDMDLVLDCKEENRKSLLKPMLRVKVNAEKCTTHVKKQVEETVSKFYNLAKYGLRLQGIKEGCIELLYYISTPLKSYLLQFKMSEDIVAEFLKHKIVSLQIDEFELKIVKVSDVTVTNTKKLIQDSKAAHSSSQIKLPLMAENIPPTENREEKSVITTEHLEPVTVYGNVVSRVVSSDELVTFNKVKKTTSGQLRVKKDSTSNNISVFVANPDIPPSEGSSGKFIQYHVPGSRQVEQPQPRCILLASQLKGFEKHFLHWNPESHTVTFQPLNYESDVPRINIKDESDQRFMWVIPVQPGNQISLKTYGQSYYLAFDCQSNPTLRRGDESDESDVWEHRVLRFTNVASCMCSYV